MATPRSAGAAGAVGRALWRGLVAGVLTLAPSLIQAAGRVSSEVDAQRIGVEDQLHLTVTLDGSVSGDIAMPSLENLKVLGGPSVSTQISLVNGQMTQAKSYTWVLQAQKVGKARIGEVKVGAETAPAIVVEVVEGSLGPRGRPADPFGDPFQELLSRRQGRTAEPKLFAEATVSRSKLRVGEAARLSFWLYTQIGVTGFDFADQPQFPGLWVEDLRRNDAPRLEAAVRDGERFQRAIILDKLIFPTRAGKLVLPANRFRVSLAPQGFFDSGATVVRATRPIELDVEALPQARGFDGAVGRFSVKATADRTTVPLGEAATYRLKIEGTGNLKWIEKAPELVVTGARVFPPQLKSDFEAVEAGLRGSRTWEFVVVPETAGRLTIPSLPFTYFDPQSARLVTLETTPVELTVEGGTMATVAAPAQVPVGGRGVVPLPLRSEIDIRPSRIPLLTPRLLVKLVILFLVGQAVFSVWPHLARVRGLGWTRRRGGHARGALRELERVARGGVARQEAVALLEKGLHEAFGEIPDDPTADGERERTARALFDEVRFVRYAPQLGDYSETLRSIAARAVQAVRRWS